MAILIGVIALAVIPNIQKSRESKDLTNLDSALSGLNVALANKTPGDADLTGTVSGLLTKTSDFAKEAQVHLGTSVQDATSSAAGSGTDMYYGIILGTSGAKSTIYVWYGDAVTDLSDANVKTAAKDRNYSIDENDSSLGTEFAVKN